ncbi:hypothetical protein K523DRAFT_251549 [Schizophyllum commune Tattone D]|nr:hypothetical protein K523DRAFT_251549 [Schizophyllum commune Tattone D]
MPFGSLFFGIAVFWILVHAANKVYLSRSQGPTLPAFVPRQRRTGSTNITVDGLHLRVQTTYLNDVHDLFAQWSLKNPQLRRVLASFYDLGTAACCAGALTALGLLLWTTRGLLATVVLFSASDDPALATPQLAKRDYIPPEPSSPTAPSSFGVRPLIPGVTVPMSHLPLMLLAVLVGQIVHEMGHAAASALEQIRISSAGLSILVLFPSAFVALPTTAIEALSPRARLRIIAGGPYHNLCYFVALWTARWLGLFAFLAPIAAMLAGYEDISGEGRMIVRVDEGSNLHAYIRQGAIMTRLDDVKLDHTTAWDDYFAEPSLSKDAMGWCVPRSHVADAPTNCCDPTLSGVPSTLACFVNGGVNVQACLDPIPLLGNPRSPRCSAAMPCVEGAVCVRPSDAAHLVRLWIEVANDANVEMPQGNGEEIVIWNGDREEVREAVQTSTWRPRFFFLPLGLPGMVEALLQYLELATLSLFPFNLLPLPMLDGEQFLRSLLDLALGEVSPYDEFDVGALEEVEAGMRWLPRNTQEAERWKERVGKGASMVTMGLLGTCVVLGLVQSVR